MDLLQKDTQITPPLLFYAQPGVMTDPKAYGNLFNGLPADAGGLCRVVQGLLIHVFWAKAYGVTLSDEQMQTLQLRSVHEKLAHMRALDERPLVEPRALDRRQVGNCRDFSTLLCAILRHQGVPARARCGFGMYFMPNHGEDHWVVEYWHVGEQRWVMVDPQLDALQCEKLNITFDPLDMPAGQFWPGGKAWLRCRAGQADPDTFGIFDMHGMGFIRGDMIRDLLALNKIELLPWDVWGLVGKGDDALTEEDLALLDGIAAATLMDTNPLCVTEAFQAVRSLYQDHANLHPPVAWMPVEK